ncbi:MAG TPA: carboxypeptidase-like regulatory domain-containing protein [Pyrinomonadaceae bacterium]|nr:carboxypeptidase-like regulatory domain-containing protein [Pyrinomonadaceae bacterium]
MAQENYSLDRLRIASPCNVGWGNMSGDDRVRFCDQCNLHVYNISEMTSAQVRALIAKSEGRVCARLYRRADGTVLTRDCPVGLRAFRRRISRMAGAALTAVLSLCSGAFGQTQSQDSKTCTRIVSLKIKKTVAQDGKGNFSGVVLEETGAVIAGAKVRLTNEQTKKKFTTTSSEDGEFKFPRLAAGNYTLEIEVEGFKPYRHKQLAVKATEALRVDATLQFSSTTVTVGVLVDTPEIESSNGAITISGEYLRRLPLPK